jgi:hypothetical protein
MQPKFFLAVNNPVKVQSSATHSEELRHPITEKFTARFFLTPSTQKCLETIRLLPKSVVL